jgi:hypothetical protein
MGNRWNILGFNFTKRDAQSSVYKISMGGWLSWGMWAGQLYIPQLYDKTKALFESKRKWRKLQASTTSSNMYSPVVNNKKWKHWFKREI